MFLLADAPKAASDYPNRDRTRFSMLHNSDTGRNPARSPVAIGCRNMRPMDVIWADRSKFACHVLFTTLNHTLGFAVGLHRWQNSKEIKINFILKLG
jgi:hypothetical protein